MGDNGCVKVGPAKPKFLKVRFRGKDASPISMTDFKEGLFELARRLQPYGDYRIKSATVYITVIDQHGDEVKLAKSGEWSISPYECAADKSDPL